jgi:putative DNA primase/helicase
MLANKIPNFADDSTALGARLIVLRMLNSFRENADPTLTERLSLDLPGILNWALIGYDRLMKARHFSETEASREERENFNRAASPTRTFIEELCAEDAPEAFVSQDDLYRAYKAWCGANKTQPDKGTDFFEAVAVCRPGKIKAHRLKAETPGAPRPRGFVGLRLVDDLPF